MAMFSTYIAWAMINAGFLYWAAFGLTLVFSFIGGVAIEQIIIWPVERAPVLTIVSVFIGLLLILNSLDGGEKDHTALGVSKEARASSPGVSEQPYTM